MLSFDEQTFAIPEWWECTWRRVGCGGKDCPMCGTDRHHQFLIDLREALRTEEEKRQHDELLELMHQAEQEALEEYQFIQDDEPSPRDIPLYNQVQVWSHSVTEWADKERQRGATWLNTEEGEDLLWYATLITGKVYRQLFNRRELDQDPDSFDIDYRYTAYVLRESINIINRSINLLLPNVISNNALMVLTSQLSALQQEILEI